MTTRWADLLALAEELDAACRTQSNVDPEKVRRLARSVIELPSTPEAFPKPTRPAPSRLH